jgi:hypothetical protein
MKIRTVIVEVLIYVLVLNFFYEGIYKIAHWHDYALWLHYAPLMKPFWVPLTYLIPIGEIALSLTLLAPSYRINALYWTITLLIIYILWLACALLFTSQLFWPYYAPWKNTSWLQKGLISIGFSWVAFIAIVLQNSRIYNIVKTLLLRLKNQ